ncbi:aminotransferase class I/II-fold pyridoxal phosphate-dependent enzyme [Trinickia sp. LjRoot230]|uniref:MalY/PatB family protein n=1 Tax=Trinickia sp. LjRoot230 TaxID=3342288 RepID=UPI003ECF0519
MKRDSEDERAGLVDFTLSEATLRLRRSEKWQQYGPQILPAHVGEMDFSVADAVRRAAISRYDEGDFGYPWGSNEALARAFAERMRARFDWVVDSERVLALGNVLQGVYASILAFSEPGDGVIVMTPSYPPLRDAVFQTARRLLALPLRSDGERYRFDVGEFDALLGQGARLLLLCNPHNPTGRAFSRTELICIGERAIAHGLIVISDEIHADLVFPGHVHIPFASLGPELAARTITLTSASKSFNIPGLRCAVAYFGSSVLQRQFDQRMPAALLGDPSPAGVDATVAAWTQGQPWLDAVIKHLTDCVTHLGAALNTQLPEIRWHAPDATYFAWLDCEALHLGVPASRFFHDATHVALAPGEAFDPNAQHFARLNFATSRMLLDCMVDRMVNGYSAIAR